MKQKMHGRLIKYYVPIILAIFATMTAAPIMSAGRFSPFGPLGMALPRQPIPDREVRAVARPLRDYVVEVRSLFLPHDAATVGEALSSGRVDPLNRVMQITCYDVD